MSSNTEYKGAVTLDGCFSIKSDVEVSQLEDAINASLSRAIATLLLVQGDGSNVDHGFTFTHEVILDALWSIESQIEQAQVLLDAYTTHRHNKT